MIKHTRIILVLYSVIVLSACTGAAYYRQSIAGHLELVRASRPVSEILADETESESLKARLSTAMNIRDFSREELYLPVGDSYVNYVDTGRSFVLWNVVATPEFSMTPQQWCYPVIGCLSYRGYFSRQEAEKYAGELSGLGYDVHIAGVTAYSTLGWFDDPLVNTMLKFDDIFLAKVMFHEMAHQLLYFRDDTEFNEAFADAVAEFGVNKWLLQQGQQDRIADFETSQVRQSEFYQLVNEYQEKLTSLYMSDRHEDEMRAAKVDIFRQMKADYNWLKIQWHGQGIYDSWFDNPMNNAKLALVLTYRDLVPLFSSLFSQNQDDPQRVYHQVRALENCSREDRRNFLQLGKIPAEC